MKNIHTILKDYWGYDKFRPMQEDIINSILNKNDTLALLPTGGGKSLCYQVPAMAMEGMCLVISPLIALMKDQVEGLRRKNITAYSIYSGMSRKDVINVLQVAGNSNCKFLYVSPERLETSLFKEYLPGYDINLIAIDEAHCISQWGYDFRPPYLRIAALREELPGVSVLALTASATPDVQIDICDKLTLAGKGTLKQKAPALVNPSPGAEQYKSWTIFRQSFERANLSYSVFDVDAKITRIIDILKKVPGCGIVYCKSRKRTKEISELLQLQNISADFYHAGLSQAGRNRKQEEWIQNKTRVIVCTNAFGMGIDKPDVRIVVHADVPDCLENYYQEAGRAGRDGKTSYAVLLYDEKDITDLENSPAIRFPSLETIRSVYQSVSNYLQLPTNEGPGNYYDFDMADFLKKFKINSHAALYSLKALEQEGWLSFNEQVFVPSQLSFSLSKEQLYSFEQQNPLHEPLIKLLLRSYAGIFDQPVYISEKLLGGILYQDVSDIQNELLMLQSKGIVQYQPQKEKPQLMLMRNRVKAEDMTIDMLAYKQRKERFEKRIRQIIHFTQESKICRSIIIGNYFGDDKIQACGICDNCLRQKATTLTQEEFDKLHHRIVEMIKSESLHSRDILLKLGGVKKEKAWKVIEFLQAENKIEMTDTGYIKFK